MSSISDPSDDTGSLSHQMMMARLHMVLEPQAMAMVAAAVFAVVVAWLVRAMVPVALLLGWLLAKQLVLLPRFMQSLAYRRALARRGSIDHARMRRSWLAFAVLDGAVWGALLWATSPLYNLELTAVLASSLMGLAAVAAFLLSVDTRAMAAFVLPMLVPNAAYLATRGDPIGVFAATSILSFAVILVLVSRSSHRRITELLRLRFDSERLAADRAHALAQAQLHSQAKSRFLATVSHEMRTPLHGILGLTRVLMQEATDRPVHERLALIERSGEHLLLVINDILDFSKIEAGRMSLDMRPFDLGQLLQEAAQVFEVLAHRKGVPLSLHLDWVGPCEVMGDPARLRQVLHNLLGNAVKFTDQGCIALTARRVDDTDQFEIQVRDTGPGIAPNELAAIFEAFHQGSDRPERRRGGTGLGLSIARQLCHAMQGTLQCDSALGMGSVFRATVCLPAAVMTRGEPERLRHDVPGANLHLNVLLVEDNPVNVLVAEAMLNNLGCRVMTVGDGQQALEWLAGHQCDVVLMDCSMPVMDGFEATRLLRQRESAQGLSRTPVVALTAHLLPTERAHCQAAGMDDYLAKPFDPEALRTVLDRVLIRVSSLRVA